MNAEQAKFLTEYFGNMLEQEGKTTAKVIAAVPDSGRNYKPDEKSRTAWDLATHLALGDVWFLDSIINGKFDFDAEGEKQAASQFKSVKDVVDYYNREFPARVKQVQGAAGRPADEDRGFLRHDADAERQLSRFRQQPQHPSPRAARRIPARHGWQGAVDLRRQR